jgi:dedicated sortase system histidine kinase
LKIGLRSKVVMVALVLAVIPWSGYLYLKQMEALLREGQEQALAATARAIAMALHDRPQLAELGTGRPATGDTALILKTLARAESRVWIVDQDRRLLALAGDLKKRSAPAEAPPGGPVEYAVRLVRPLTDRLLERPSEDFDDALSDAEMAEGSVAASALQGVPARRSRLTSDGRAVILSAAYPVWSGENVAAAVVAEETTNAARSVYGRALEQVVAVTLIVLVAGALTLLLFASRLSVRLRRLRNEAEAAIDSQGRVRGLLSGSTAGDEIGDLSRSFSTALERLAQYNRYLEAMGGRLSHELRTPIAVVRSSLDNLKMQHLPQEAGIYLERAGEGLRRLDTILRRMTEATRLEQLVREPQRERFDAREVVRGAALAYPQSKFEVDIPDNAVLLSGSPDLYAQMLDKLVANAVDFSAGDEPIRVRLSVKDAQAVLTVSNRGARLPEAMAGKLFESMVSLRGDKGGAEPHLGLGLYIVRLVAEFHGGKADALDREDGSGVVIRVTCPISP